MTAAITAIAMSTNLFRASQDCEGSRPPLSVNSGAGACSIEFSSRVPTAFAAGSAMIVGVLAVATDSVEIPELMVASFFSPVAFSCAIAGAAAAKDRSEF